MEDMKLIQQLKIENNKTTSYTIEQDCELIICVAEHGVGEMFYFYLNDQYSKVLYNWKVNNATASITISIIQNGKAGTGIFTNSNSSTSQSRTFNGGIFCFSKFDNSTPSGGLSSGEGYLN